MTPNRVFVIGLKNYIELRVAHQPPKKIVTKFEKPVTVKVYEPCWNFRGDPPRFKIVNKQLKIVTTFYMGGRVLCIIKRKKFIVLTKRVVDTVRVKTGAMKELPPWLAQAFLDRKWRKQYHV